MSSSSFGKSPSLPSDVTILSVQNKTSPLEKVERIKKILDRIKELKKWREKIKNARVENVGKEEM